MNNVDRYTKLSVHHDKFPSPNTVLRRQQISCLVTWLARLAGGRSGSYEADNSYSNTIKGKIAATNKRVHAPRQISRRTIKGRRARMKIIASRKRNILRPEEEHGTFRRTAQDQMNNGTRQRLAVTPNRKKESDSRNDGGNIKERSHQPDRRWWKR